MDAIVKCLVDEIYPSVGLLKPDGSSVDMSRWLGPEGFTAGAVSNGSSSVTATIVQARSGMMITHTMVIDKGTHGDTYSVRLMFEMVDATNSNRLNRQCVVECNDLTPSQTKTAICRLVKSAIRHGETIIDAKNEMRIVLIVPENVIDVEDDLGFDHSFAIRPGSQIM